MLRLCGNVSPAGLQDSCVCFPVADATGRDVSAAGLNRRSLARIAVGDFGLFPHRPQAQA